MWSRYVPRKPCGTTRPPQESKNDDQTHAPFLLLHHSRDLLQRFVSFCRQEHAGECEFHCLSFGDICRCVCCDPFYLFLFPCQKRSCGRTQTTQLGQHRACDCCCRNRIWFSACLSGRLEFGNRRSIN